MLEATSFSAPSNRQKTTKPCHISTDPYFCQGSGMSSEASSALEVAGRESPTRQFGGGLHAKDPCWPHRGFGWCLSLLNLFLPPPLSKDRVHRPHSSRFWVFVIREICRVLQPISDISVSCHFTALSQSARRMRNGISTPAIVTTYSKDHPHLEYAKPCAYNIPNKPHFYEYPPPPCPALQFGQ